MTAAANHSNKLYIFFTPVLRQAVLTPCPLNLCMLQHTYRPATALLLWREVGDSGRSSSCGLQLALNYTELVRSHVYIALGWGLWADTEWFNCTVPRYGSGHNCR